MVPDKVQDVAQVAHDTALAAWVGGALFGRVAHNPSLRAVSSRAERGKVANAAWNGYNAVNLAAMLTVGGVQLAGRLTELRDENLGARERPIVRAMDALTATAVATGLLSGIQGARLARQAPEGAVPIEDGTRPGPDTPPAAARIQRSLGVLGAVNLVAGFGLVAANGLFWRSAVSRPPKRRALRRRS
jgi:hypothetical protein